MLNSNVSGPLYGSLSIDDRKLLRVLGREADLSLSAKELGCSSRILLGRCKKLCKKLQLHSLEELRSSMLSRLGLAGRVFICNTSPGQMILPLGLDRTEDTRLRQRRRAQSDDAIIEGITAGTQR
jgi:hypothetical protein